MERLTLVPDRILGSLERIRQPELLKNARCYAAREAGDGLEYRFEPRLLATSVQPPLLPRGPLLDELGQSTLHDWPGKTRSIEALVARLRGQQVESAASWPEQFSRWGGWLGRQWAAKTITPASWTCAANPTSRWSRLPGRRTSGRTRLPPGSPSRMASSPHTFPCCSCEVA
jgi:hypothetical protein